MFIIMFLYICRLIDLENSRAEGVKKGREFLKMEEEINPSTVALIRAGADGAGVRNGLMQKIREDSCPWLVTIHCIAHRLELAIKDALKQSVFSEVSYWHHFSYSIKLISGLLMKIVYFLQIVNWNT